MVLLAGFCLLFAHQALAEAGMKHYSDELPCGQAVARLETDCFDAPDGWECVKQSLIMRNVADRSARTVGLDERSVALPRPSRRSVLDGYVTGWACIRSKHQVDFLLLWYSCRGLVNRCAIQGLSAEWIQIASTDGKVVAGSKDNIDDNVEKRLGLDALLQQGVPLLGVGPLAQAGR